MNPKTPFAHIFVLHACIINTVPIEKNQKNKKRCLLLDERTQDQTLNDKLRTCNLDLIPINFSFDKELFVYLSVVSLSLLALLCLATRNRLLGTKESSSSFGDTAFSVVHIHPIPLAIGEHIGCGAEIGTATDRGRAKSVGEEDKWLSLFDFFLGFAGDEEDILVLEKKVTTLDGLSESEIFASGVVGSHCA